MKTLFIFVNERQLIDAGFHPSTRLHCKDRDARATSYEDLMDADTSYPMHKLKGLHPDMIVLDSSVTPFMMTLHHKKFGSLVAWMRARFRNTVWVGNWPEWEQV